MAEATSALIATLDMTELIDRLAGLCVPRLADWVFLTLLDDYGRRPAVRRPARGGPSGRAAGVRRRCTPGTCPGSPSRRSIATSRPVLLDELTPEVLDAVFVYPGALEAFDRLGGTSVLTVPHGGAAPNPRRHRAGP